MPLESGPSQKEDEKADGMKPSLSKLKKEISKQDPVLDEEPIRKKGEKVFMLYQTTRLRDISKEEAKALKHLKSGDPCLYQYYAYKGMSAYENHPRDIKFHSEFLLLKEVTPLKLSDLEKRGYKKKRVSKTFSLERIGLTHGQTNDQRDFALLDQVIRWLGIHVESKTTKNTSVHEKNEILQHLETVFNQTIDIEAEYIISGLRIEKQEGDKYEVSFDLYLKPK